MPLFNSGLETIGLHVITSVDIFARPFRTCAKTKAFGAIIDAPCVGRRPPAQARIAPKEIVGQPSRFKCRAFAQDQKAFLHNGVIHAHDVVHGESNRLLQTDF
ncbi:hypothetical protein [Paraburkholderia atlantica]|uniref:hypothetical protein n=1 Tax=Paraburkholderia atlantica TaxID=2654982 RepID=UPI00160EF451|nr:hypothetical protein [Paraburkholderia atlantica]MBB5420018.1 hypothetical protein [Paraburkholderia atlantica]